MLLPAARQNQERFLPEPDIQFTSLAQRRVYVGDFFEQATQALIPDATRLQTSTAADICPDFEHKSGFLETKSVGKSQEIIIRKGKLEREQTFCENNTLFYVLWIHTCPVMTVDTRTTMHVALAQHVRRVVILPAYIIHALCQLRPLTSWKYNETRTEGYRIRMRDINESMGSIQEFAVWHIVVNKHKFAPFALLCRGIDPKSFLKYGV
jgi:hypothetical protein